MTEHKYEGYGYHGGGRPKKKEKDKVVYKNITISGKPDEIVRLKKNAKKDNKSVSRYVLDNLT